jgi:hypothetical protein
MQSLAFLSVTPISVPTSSIQNSIGAIKVFIGVYCRFSKIRTTATSTASFHYFAERVEADKRNLQSFQSIKAPASSIIGELRYQQMTGFIHEECGTLYARAPSVHIKTTLEVGVR